jgi:hypothetical protein
LSPFRYPTTFAIVQAEKKKETKIYKGLEKKKKNPFLF